MNKKNTLNRAKNNSDLGKSAPKAVRNILNKTHLSSLVTKSNKIKAVEDYIKHSISPEWGSYYHVLNLNGNTLIVGACNSAVAHKIRLNSMDWLYSLRQAHWPQLRNIEVKVHDSSQAKLPSRFKQASVQRSVADDIAQKMQSIAGTMDDAELQQAWVKLTQVLQEAKSDH